MTIKADFERSFQQTWPVQRWAHVNVIAAVSGGADSVAMLRAMHSIRAAHVGEEIPENGFVSHSDREPSELKSPVNYGELIVVHVHHMLREGADQDADFVRDLCQELDLRFVFRKVNTPRMAKQAGDGIESAARELRHNVFQEESRTNAARYVATAHTADDQAETVLHRIVRGTGVRGLTGIPFTRPLDHASALIRPVLSFRRHEIESYLSELGQAYRSDETNTDTAYTRNRIRHELLPMLTDSFNPSVCDALLRLSQSAVEIETAMAFFIDRLADHAMIGSTANQLEIDCGPVEGLPDYLLSEFLIAQWTAQNWPRQGMTREHWCRLVEMMRDEHGVPATSFPGGVVAEKRGKRRLVLRRS